MGPTIRQLLELDPLEYDFDHRSEVVSWEAGGGNNIRFLVLSRNCDDQHWIDPDTGELAVHYVDKMFVP